MFGDELRKACDKSELTQEGLSIAAKIECIVPLYSFGKIPLSRVLSRSMATIASSTSLPMVGCFALSCRCCQRASAGTQKTF